MARSRFGNHNAMIHRKLAEILLRETKDPRFRRLTISRVEAASDMSFAKVYFSIFPSELVEELGVSLNRAAGFFSRTLGRSLDTRNTPKLIFVHDKGFDHSTRIDQLLKGVNQD